MARKRRPNTVLKLTCEKCKAGFELSRKPKAGTGILCKKCRGLRYEQEFVKRNGLTVYEKYSPRYKDKRRESQLKLKYGLTSKEYDAMFERQGGCCAICKRTDPGIPRCEHFAIDHDHATGKVRGLLCHVCNRMLGHVKDEPSLLNAAVNYLIRNDPARSWDRYFMRIAEVVATRSKDPSTQVGAVLVRNNRILATGYNGFPSGVNDNVPGRWERPEKYFWVCHAEENCVAQCALHGISAKEGSLYVTPLLPCSKCAIAIVSCGIKEVIVPTHFENSRWKEENEKSVEIFNAARVILRHPE